MLIATFKHMGFVPQQLPFVLTTHLDLHGFDQSHIHDRRLESIWNGSWVYGSQLTQVGRDGSKSTNSSEINAK